MESPALYHTASASAAELKDIEKAVDALQTQLHYLERANFQLRQENNELLNKVTAFEYSVADLRDKLVEAERTSDERRDSYAAEIESQRIDELESENESIAAERDRLVGQVLHLEERCCHLQKQVAELLERRESNPVTIPADFKTSLDSLKTKLGLIEPAKP